MNLYLRPEGDLCWILGCVNPCENAFQVMYPDKICYIEGILENPLRLKEVTNLFVFDVVSLLRMGNIFWRDVKALGVCVHTIALDCRNLLHFMGVESSLFRIDLALKASEVTEALPMGQFRFDFFPDKESVLRNAYVFDKYFIWEKSSVSNFFGIPDNVVQFDSSTGFSVCGMYFSGNWSHFITAMEKLPSLSVGRSGIHFYVAMSSVDLNDFQLYVDRFHMLVDGLKKSYKIHISFHCCSFDIGAASLLEFKSGGVKVTVSEDFKYPVKRLHDFLVMNKKLVNDEPFATKTAMFGESDESISD